MFNNEFNEPSKHLKLRNPALHQWIMQMTAKLDDPKFKYNIATRVHWILMGFTDFPKCANPNCQNYIGINKNVVWCRGYVKYCSLKCGTKCSRDKSNKTLHEHAIEDSDFFMKIEQKKKHTRIKNHGDPNWNNREQAEKTCLEHLGVRHPIANKEVLSRSLKTREKKYGKGNLSNTLKT